MGTGGRRRAEGGGRCPHAPRTVALVHAPPALLGAPCRPGEMNAQLLLLAALALAAHVRAYETDTRLYDESRIGQAAPANDWVEGQAATAPDWAAIAGVGSLGSHVSTASATEGGRWVGGLQGAAPRGEAEAGGCAVQGRRAGLPLSVPCTCALPTLFSASGVLVAACAPHPCLALVFDLRQH